MGRPRKYASESDRIAASIDRLRHIDRRECEDPKRRARLEKNPEKWLKHYLPQAFTRPFRKAHHSIIDGAVNAQQTHGRWAVAAERGIGKSTLLWGLVLMFALTGRERFPVCLPWADSALKRALRFWKNALCYNPALYADYPEYCVPFKESRGISQRVSQLCWKDNGKPTGAQLRITEGMIIMPDSLGAIGGATINGNPRGLNHPQDDGGVLRPSLVMIDDPQSREVAMSQLRVQRTIEMIDSDVAGIGESGKALSMLISGNCIVPGDVMEHYLNQPEWQALKVSRIIEWPEGFDNEKSKVRKLWEEWNKVRVDGLHDRDGGKGARKFYRANKAAMTKGMVVSNEDGYDKDQKQPDALYGAMESYFVMGHSAFMAERQQDPVTQMTTYYTLSAQLILSRKSGYARLHAPVGSVLCLGIDVNYVGFNWVLVAAETASQSRKIVAHGLYPGGTKMMIQKNVTDAQACAIIRREMARFDAEVIRTAKIKCGDEVKPISIAGWDASSGKWQDAMAAAIKEMRSPVQQIPMKAFGAKTYKPRRTDLRQGKGWHVTDFPRIGRVFVLNADYWRETMQRGFVVEPTEPGALSLYEPDTNGMHRDLARSILSEQLVEKVVTDKGEYYNWHRDRSVPNDRADAAVYACALTGYEGIGEEKARKKRGGVRVVMSRGKGRLIA